jgi:ribosomal protein L11 methyltransferase
VRVYPALALLWPEPPAAEVLELALAAADDFQPIAVEDQPLGVRIYFSTVASRDAALSALATQTQGARLTAEDVPDENWAERSQAALTPVTIGRVTVMPPWAVLPPARSDEIRIVIEPSMGFGTGHHASTRLCLALAQRLPLAGATVLDVGTGSGLLAIAARRLGADTVLAIDSDADAIEAARDSVERNDCGGQVTVVVRDVTDDPSALATRFRLTLANLTGGLLIRIAPSLLSTLSQGGHLIASGFQETEEADVRAAFVAAGGTVVDRTHEDGWVGVVLNVLQSS